MKISIDTSVLVAAMVEGEVNHRACHALLLRQSAAIYSHGIAEAFSTLTGGRSRFRLDAEVAAELLGSHYVPKLQVASLTPDEIMRALKDAKIRGIRGGAIYDWLHLAAARKAKATHFYTLNLADFRHMHRSGDPEIVAPEA